MEPLRNLVTELGFSNVRTLVNSGNVVFSSDTTMDGSAIARQLETALLEQHELDVPVVVRSAAELAEIVAANPFPEVAATPKLLHVSFLANPLDTDQLALLNTLDTGDDRIVLRGRNIYMHVPNGLSGASPATIAYDRKLKIVATGRNWNTVTTLAAMSAEAT